MIAFQIAFGIFAGLSMAVLISIVVMSLGDSKGKRDWVWQRVDTLPAAFFTVLYAFALYGLYKLLIWIGS